MKFNIRTRNKNKTLNYEASTAYRLTPEMELYSAVVTSALNNKFYEKADKRIQRIQALIQKTDPKFVAQLAAYARQKMYMRTIPLVLTTELAKVHKGDSLVSQMVENTVQRADEITELLAYYELANGRTKRVKKLNKLSKQIQKGLANAFNRFDEYQFAKYNRNASIKLKDALFLVHPKAKDESQQVIFNKIVNDNLAVPYTWETELSALGQQKFAHEGEKKTAFRNKWEELIDSGRVGYMALMRNLRNIIEADVSKDHIKKVCSKLGNPAEVARAKQFPFRFLAAYREIKPLASGKASRILNALENAVLASAANIKGFDEDTKVVIACDVSGSMQQPISARSKVLAYDIGLILGMLLQARCENVISGMFGDRWKIINMPNKNILSNVQEMYRREGEVGYSTNGYLIIEDLIKRRKIVDKVFIFTDCQLWDSNGYWGKNNKTIAQLWTQYKAIAPKAKIYLFDLAGYGNTPLEIKSNDAYLIAGWSDKVFDVLDAIENGASALHLIKQMEL